MPAERPQNTIPGGYRIRSTLNASCPYRDPDLQRVYLEGADAYDLPVTAPLRGVVDVSRPKRERDAFSRGWKARLELAQKHDEPHAGQRSQDIARPIPNTPRHA